jgi:hypothetical protein
MCGACGTYEGRLEALKGFWWGNLKEVTPLGDPRRSWEDNIEVERSWSGLMWLGIGTGAGLL